MDITVEFEGLQELEEQLQALTAVVAKNQIYSAISYGLTPIVSEIRNNAPKAAAAYYRYSKGGKKIGGGRKSEAERHLEQPGRLRSQVRRWRVKGLPDSYGVGVGIKKKSKEYVAFYWYFIEYGTAKQAAVPFIRPAFDAGKEKAVERYMDKLRKNIDRVIAKQALEAAEIISEEG